MAVLIQVVQQRFHIDYLSTFGDFHGSPLYQKKTTPDFTLLNMKASSSLSKYSSYLGRKNQCLNSLRSELIFGVTCNVKIILHQLFSLHWVNYLNNDKLHSIEGGLEFLVAACLDIDLGNEKRLKKKFLVHYACKSTRQSTSTRYKLKYPCLIGFH